MKIEFLTNQDFFKAHKSDFLKTNNVFLENDFFYTMKQPLNYPSSLTHLKEYLSYVNSINIYLDFTLVAFINLIVIVSYLQEIGYQNDITLHYFQKSTFQIVGKKDLNRVVRNHFNVLLQNVLKKEALSFINELQYAIPNYRQCVQLYQTILHPQSFKMIVDECFQQSESKEEAISYFLEHYSEYGLSNEYLQECFPNENEV